MAAVMPGTTSNRKPAAASACALFATAAENKRVAPLEPDHLLPGPAQIHQQVALI